MKTITNRIELIREGFGMFTGKPKLSVDATDEELTQEARWWGFNAKVETNDSGITITANYDGTSTEPLVLEYPFTTLEWEQKLNDLDDAYQQLVEFCNEFERDERDYVQSILSVQR